MQVVKTFALALAASMVAFGASAAGLGVRAKLNNINPSNTVKVDVEYINSSNNVPGTPTGNINAGVNNFTRSSSNNSSNDYTGPGLTKGGTFQAFCIELNQSVSTNSWVDYQITPLSDSPNPGTGIPGVNGMGAAKATALQKLWFSYFADALISNVNAAAFQLAVWEIVYEGEVGEADGTPAYNVGNGNFRYMTTGSTANTIKNLANTYLAGYANATGLANLIALSANGKQDMVTALPPPPPPVVGVVPLPSAVYAGMALLSAAGGMSYLRRQALKA